MTTTMRMEGWNTNGLSTPAPGCSRGGLLVWVVPQHMLRFRKATRYILSWYDQVQIFRFPDEEYDRFKQIVLFGVLRPKAVAPDGEMVEKLAQLAVGKEMLPSLTAVSEPTYTLPPLTVKHRRIQIPLPICRSGRRPGRGAAAGRQHQRCLAGASGPKRRQRAVTAAHAPQNWAHEQRHCRRPSQ